MAKFSPGRRAARLFVALGLSLILIGLVGHFALDAAGGLLGGEQPTTCILHFGLVTTPPTLMGGLTLLAFALATGEPHPWQRFLPPLDRPPAAIDTIA